ncbi:GNAT family N-acetyltransferase [Plastorhodobacter daqingensis]|uniref:GNAT family N-acetyltransferase n=1 Tax=Plastorhodobacter daqingensis TaxID=1387281 RepID=A0ABW2ULT3_9RHOB
MIRRAGDDDLARLEAFLSRNADSTMFLRANLGRAPFWIWGRDGIEGTVGLSPGEGPRHALIEMVSPPDWPALRQALSGYRIAGMNGTPGQVAALRAGLGLADRPAQVDEVEQLLALDLTDLRVPPGPGQLRPATPADLALLADWRALYRREALGDPPTDNRQRAVSDVTAMLERGHVHFLADGDVPLAMTNFNAVHAGMVQIGGVFTPAPLRGQGHARRVVALHLAKARAEGTRRAVLFARDPNALRAYQAVGFRNVGGYHLLIFAEPADPAAPGNAAP